MSYKLGDRVIIRSTDPESSWKELEGHVVEIIEPGKTARSNVRGGGSTYNMLRLVVSTERGNFMRITEAVRPKS